jgi:hypothetical protein
VVHTTTQYNTDTTTLQAAMHISKETQLYNTEKILQQQNTIENRHNNATHYNTDTTTQQHADTQHHNTELHTTTHCKK